MVVQKIIIFALLSLVPQVFSFWTPCPNGRPPINVYTTACSPTGCRVVRGEPVYMNATVDFLETHQDLRPRGTAFIFGIPVVLPPYIDSICPSIALDGVHHGCPVHPNVVYSWTVDMILPTTVPTFSNARVRVEVLDGTRTVSCFEVIGSIV